MEVFHDPREFIRGLQQILISDTKRIGFLCGAGTSMAAPRMDKAGNVVFKDKENRFPEPLIAGVWKMTEDILKGIGDDDFKKAIVIIKEELEDAESDLEKKKNALVLENLISSIDQKIRVVGKGNLCGLNKKRFKEFRSLLQTEIKKIVSVHRNEEIKLDVQNLLHTKFARWIKYASRKNPVELFTTNYDYLFEIGFEFIDLPYYDGFVGSYNPFFDPISVENDSLIPQWTRLWKVHGSLGWGYDETERKIIRSRQLSDDGIVIYPSLLKYDDSRKQPYLSYIDRLSSFLKKDDGVLFICGYSFGDDHLNEAIINSLQQSRSSTVIALVFDKDLKEASVLITKKAN